MGNQLYLIDFSNLFLTYYAIFKNTKNLVPLILDYIFKISTISSQSFFIFVSEPNSKFLKKKQIYPQYKEKRQKIDDKVFHYLYGLKKDLFDFLKFHNINLILSPEYEADDVIGMIINLKKNDFVHLIIISNDNDFIQLVEDYKVRLITRKYIYGLSKDSDTLFLSQKLLKNSDSYLPTGIPYLLFKILQGDRGDNIPSIFTLKNLKLIFRKQNKSEIDKLTISDINDVDTIMNFLKKIDDKLLDKFDPNKYLLNLKLISLYPPNINEIKIDNLDKYFISGELLKTVLLNKKFLFKL